MTTTMTLDRKRFINGRLAQEGETIDLDEKGGFMPAGSTPVDQMSIEQLETILARRKKDEGDTAGDDIAKVATSKAQAKAPAKAAKGAAAKPAARGAKASPPPPPAAGDDLTLEGKTVEQLREIAERESVEIAEGADAPAIIEAITAKRDDV